MEDIRDGLNPLHDIRTRNLKQYGIKWGDKYMLDSEANNIIM